MPELTVVIPTRDRPGMLVGAVESVLAQAAHAEVIVVDDGSAPDHAARIRALCAADRRVRLVRNESPHGAPHGRNQGLLLARGGYWATLDDDDRWLPGKWEAQREILLAHGRPDDLVVVTGMRTAHPDRHPVQVPAVRSPERFRSLSDLFRRVPPAAFLNSYVVPTELMRGIGGYDERLVWGEHTDVLIRLARVARFAGSGHLGVVVDRAHAGAASRVGRDWVRKVEGIRVLLEKHAEAFAGEPELRAQYLDVLGVTQLRAGDRRGALATFLRVLTRAPSAGRRARALGHLAVALGGGRRWRRAPEPPAPLFTEAG